jgi:hypothetical protein
VEMVMGDNLEEEGQIMAGSISEGLIIGLRSELFIFLLLFFRKKEAKKSRLRIFPDKSRAHSAKMTFKNAEVAAERKLHFRSEL